MRPVLKEVDPDALHEDGGEAGEQTVAWSSVDRLNMSVGLLYALCVNATDSDVSCGFCVPRSQLLKRWQVCIARPALVCSVAIRDRYPFPCVVPSGRCRLREARITCRAAVTCVDRLP